MDLQTPISQGPRSYKMFAGRLEKLGITKFEDFLFHIPFRYDDYSLVSRISEVQPGEIVTIKGVVEEIHNQYARSHKTFQRAKIKDATGTIGVMWFNQPFLTRAIKQGDEISVSGKAESDGNKLTMISPVYEIIFNNQMIHTGRLVPVYPETRGVSSKWLRRQVFKILEDKSQINETLPDGLIKDNSLMDLPNALEKIHFPDNLEQAQKARERLSFEELFQIQLSSLVRRKTWEKEEIKKTLKIDRNKIEKLIKSLPFELTSSQKNAVEEILKDLSGRKAMNRLLEGDVGSGKTVVGAIAIYAVFLNGFQSAFMAPTEILANQHFKTLKDILSPLGVKIELLTGSTKLKSEDFDVLIGTHALVYKKAKFKKLDFVVIDEQQRFGVEQRAIIREKGKNVHVLTMTATPIPRTVALTMYGDLDLSVLSEMPKERLAIKTWLVPPTKRDRAYDWIEKQITKNHDQVFIVCPFIEESETMVTVKAAAKEFERLKTQVFKSLRLGLLHGRMKSKEKEEILSKFREGEIDILVSTPVVEVGIDIKNATIMLVEEAERFGLAQLHQLRGRVGRGIKQSYCLLFTGSQNPETLERLKAMETMNSGAELAELDLKLRGPGQVFGTSQHGVTHLKVASFSDFDLIDKTKKEAEKIFPEINKYPSLLAKVELINLTQVSRD